MYMYIYFCTDNYVYIYIYIYIYIHTHTLIYKHFFIYAFIYYSKYKSSGATLNINQIKKHKKLKFLIHQNDFFWLLLMLHRFSAFFPPKTGGRLKIFLPSFLARVVRGEPHF